MKLGCVMPGEPPPVPGDALRRLAAAATYLIGRATGIRPSLQLRNAIRTRLAAFHVPHPLPVCQFAAPGRRADEADRRWSTR